MSMAGRFVVDSSDMPLDSMGTNSCYPSAPASPYPVPFDIYSGHISFSNQDAASDGAYLHPMDCTFANHSGTIYGSVDPWSGYSQKPFGELDDSYTAFPSTRRSHTASSSQSPLPRTLSGSPETTPPLPVYSHSLSPQSSGHDSDATYHSPDGDAIPQPPRRQRNRSRLSSRTQTVDPRRPTCVPHKQVERKYREGLNMEFERLRRAVPTLPQSVEANVMGTSKPSKGMVLAAAIEYIKRVERERDAAVREIERLGGKGSGRFDRRWGGGMGT